MKKPVKIKESDIKAIVTKIIRESNGSLDEYMYLNPKNIGMGDEGETDVDLGTADVTLAKSSKTGDVYVLKDAFSENPEILGIISMSGEVKMAAE